MATTETCNRVRDAVAVGRVFGDATLLEHAKACEVCASELAVLKKRRDFRDAFPVLMSIADQSERPPAPKRAGPDDARQRASRRHLYVMIAAVIAIVGFLNRKSIFRAGSTTPQGDAKSATAAPKFRISNIENAVFESKADGGTVRTSQTRGVAAYHVELLREGQRFLLALPDGDLEVRGTRFVVSVEGGKTQGIEVSEGTVALSLPGRAEVILAAGDRWPPAGSAARPTVSFLRSAPRKDAAPPDP
jgi:ferric-dicitrate binding protein FerR (iron transport regulator)